MESALKCKDCDAIVIVFLPIEEEDTLCPACNQPLHEPDSV